MADEALDDRELNEALDEDIRKTLGDIQSRNKETDTATDAPLIEATPSNEDVAAQPAADTRARDESGKFIAKEQSAAPEQASQPNAQEATAPVAAAPTDQIDLARPPSSWKPAAKAAWNALPPEVQAEIYRREGDFHKGNSAIKENADFGLKIRTMAQPYDMLIRAEGSTHEAAFDDYLKSASLLRTGTPQQRLDLIKQLDSRFNCGLGQDVERYVQQRIAQATGQAAPEQPQHPQQSQIDQILQWKEQQEREREEAARQFEAQMNKQAADAWNKLRAEVDANGQQAYPFIDNVNRNMGPFISQVIEANPSLAPLDILKQAYDLAVWANPETRAVLISQKQAQANQPADNLRKVEQAKRASAVNVPKRGALPATGPAKTIDETIRETGQALGMF